MKRLRDATLLLVFALVFSSRTLAQAPPSKVVTFTILHINDVYEINPLGADGGTGGLARVAGLRKNLALEDPNTFMVLAGDLFSPSPMGLLPRNSAWKGKQMVDVFNVAGLDLSVLGNHEFDVKPAEFAARISESRFPWISANVSDGGGQPFPGVVPFHLREFRGKGGASVRVAFVGVTVDSNRVNWARYADFREALRRALGDLRGKADVVIGLTHLDLADDMQLARDFPELVVILGGHEHEAHNDPQTLPRRTTATVFKADANAVSAWIHRFKVDLATRTGRIESKLVHIDRTVADDPVTAAAAKVWTDQFSALIAPMIGGHKPEDVLKTFDFKLEGRDSLTRTGPTNLGRFVARTMTATLPAKTDKDARPRVGLLNSGSIRIDDDIPAKTPIRYYDVLRILPYGGAVKHVQMNGNLLRRVLDQSENSMKEKGGYLQYSGLVRDGTDWKVENAAVADDANYLVAISDYLFQWLESDYEYLNVGGKLAEGMTLEPKQPDPVADDIQKLVITALFELPADAADMKALRTSQAVKYEPTGTSEFSLAPAEPPPSAPPAPPAATVHVPTPVRPDEETKALLRELIARLERSDRRDDQVAVIVAVATPVLVITSCATLYLLFVRKPSTPDREIKEIRP